MRRDNFDNLRHVIAAGVAIIVAISAGCAAPSAPASGPAALTPAAARGPRTTAAVDVSATVQVLQDYQAAKRACAHGAYRRAAQILSQMQKSSTLTSDQKAFCHKQELICLDHLSPLSAVSKSKMPVARSHTGLSAPAEYSADCGPRALLLACERLGVKTTLPDLTRSAGTGASGTTMSGLKHAAEALKLKVEGVQSSREALPDQALPAIGWSHGNHYIAVLSWNGRGDSGTATIQDPNEAAPRTVSQEKLLQATGGYLLTLRR